ncbi:MAG: 4-hydroxy-tetrahydrodipicolinate synthase [Clostridiales bacterium]|jgi:4-hydroxy-tetrahydrodipicolinate synthase|nr:4-hydroxy-tetrahydrodipicolinate synthase [Clostridiales bacterium]
MHKERLRGIIAPLVTPFNQNENLDEITFRREVKYLLGTGIHGISPGGSTGEGAVLSDDELARMVEIIQEENKNHLPIVAGIIRNSARDAVRAGLAVKKAGASALMVTPTHYNVLVPDEEGNFDFYRRISEEVGLPIIIYNVVPQNPIGPSLFNRMLENIENVVGIKQSVGGIQAFYEMKLLCGEKALIYSATDDMLYSTFDLGADGAIAAILTAFPEISVQIWDAVQEGNDEEAKALQHKIYLVWQVIKGDHFPRRIKETLRQLGREVGIARSPILEATEEEKQRIKEALKNLG